MYPQFSDNPKWKQRPRGLAVGISGQQQWEILPKSEDVHTDWWASVAGILLHQLPQELVGGLEHLDYFPFHIWDVILPIDELHHVSRWFFQPPTRLLYIYITIVIYIYIQYLLLLTISWTMITWYQTSCVGVSQDDRRSSAVGRDQVELPDALLSMASQAKDVGICPGWWGQLSPRSSKVDRAMGQNPGTLRP